MACCMMSFTWNGNKATSKDRATVTGLHLKTKKHRWRECPWPNMIRAFNWHRNRPNVLALQCSLPKTSTSWYLQIHGALCVDDKTQNVIALCTTKKKKKTACISARVSTLAMLWDWSPTGSDVAHVTAARCTGDASLGLLGIALMYAQWHVRLWC